MRLKAGAAPTEAQKAQTELWERARTAWHIQQRSIVRDLLISNAKRMAERALEITDGPLGKGQGAVVRDLMVSCAIALDKYRLEMGEVTTRDSVEVSSPADAVAAALDELAERRTIGFVAQAQ